MTNRSCSPVWVVLPVKSLAAAKMRLQDALAAAERRALFRNMLNDVLAQIARARQVDGALIATRDAEVRALAARYGMRVLDTAADEGQSSAVTSAAQTLAAQGVRHIVTLPGDVPLITAAEIDAVCSSIAPAPAMTIVPNRDNTGSNSIACSPPCAIPFMFGKLSLARHLRAADERHVTTRVLRLPGLSLDIDVAADLLEFLRYDSKTATHEFLIASGIAARLRHSEFALTQRAAAVSNGRLSQ